MMYVFRLRDVLKFDKEGLQTGDYKSREERKIA